MRVYIKDFFSKFDLIHSKMWIGSHLLKKSLTQNSIFCLVPENLLEKWKGGGFITKLKMYQQTNVANRI